MNKITKVVIGFSVLVGLVSFGSDAEAQRPPLAPSQKAAMEAKMKAGSQQATEAQTRFDLILRKIETSAESAQPTTATTAPNLHVAGRTPMFADNGGVVTISGNDALRKAMIDAVHGSSVQLAATFALADVYAGFAKFSLRTAISFPGFSAAASHIGLVTEIATTAGGLATAGSTAFNKPKAANISVAIAAIAAGIGGYSTQKSLQQGTAGQSSLLQTAFQDLNKAAQDIAVLQYLQQDYDITGKTLDDLATASNKLASESLPTDDSGAEAYANEYLALVKSVDALYDGGLVTTKTAVDAQAANQAFDQQTLDSFRSISQAIDRARSTWALARSSSDATATQATKYLATMSQ
ncbi:MAG TPA: hypothetical protein VGJ33_14275 [Candidatus Angelobacter sp.]